MVVNATVTNDVANSIINAFPSSTSLSITDMKLLPASKFSDEGSYLEYKRNAIIGYFYNLPNVIAN